MTVTVGSEIDLLSGLCLGHNIPSDTLARWLSDVDGYIYSRVWRRGEFPSDYSYTDSRETPLLLQNPPHRRIYFLYLRAMVDFASGQYSSYSNGIGAYNSAMAEYVHAYLCDRDRGEEE